jgi:ABC-type branched-subunit amino acid transport system substrate-binding protein
MSQPRGEIVAFERFCAGDQDFSPQITKIRSLKRDAIYVAAATSAASTDAPVPGSRQGHR